MENAQLKYTRVRGPPQFTNRAQSGKAITFTIARNFISTYN